MPYFAENPATYEGKTVGTGHCVPFVQAASGAPLTFSWARGVKVRGSGIKQGAAIATFDANGKYGNHTDGTSHAAIYISQDDAGIRVWDQWLGQPVHQRTIRFQGGAAGIKPVNDGDAFYLIT